MIPKRLPSRGLALLLTLALAGCFEPPVREDVAIRFDEKGGVEVVVTTQLGKDEDYRRNPPALERLLSAREAARCGDDPFTRQLEKLSPVSLRRAVSSREGSIRESIRTATFPDARSVERLFEGEPLSLVVSRSGGETQLEIVPGRGGRATAAERMEVNRELDRFAAAAARYLASLATLWAWLDEHPAEERIAVAALLGVELPIPADLSRDERLEALFDDVSDAMARVHDFFLLSDGRGESLDELSRKAFDPFPAPLRVRVAGTVVESAGFVREEDGGFRVPPVSLWGALSGLSGRWVAPDPLAEQLRREERGVDEPPDVDRFLAGGRRVLGRPAAGELREAVESALVPAPLYRLRWKSAPPP